MRGPRAGIARACGFTLIELLVVIAIIGILVMLLLPSVQSAREAARRISCVNNIRQIALAAQNYESANKVLPPSGIVDYREVKTYYGTYEIFQQTEGKMFSWAVLILPYIEQQNLHDQFQFDRPVTQQQGRPQEQFVSTYLCPSDSAEGRYFVDGELTGGRLFAKGNYAAYVSPYHIDLQMRFPGAIVGKGQPLTKVVDGLSSTIAFSEVRTRDHMQDERGAWALSWTGATLLAFDMHSIGNEQIGFRLDARSEGNTQPPNNAIGIANGGTLINGNRDVLQICPEPEEADLLAMPCFNAKEALWLSAAPRSHHPGGVNAAFADGRVVFLQNDVDDYAMANLVGARDGEVVDLERLGL